MNTEWDVHNETERITEWIRDWFMQNGPKAHAVIGISGGKDSSIVSALLVSALGRERVVGVMMPDGVQKDIEDARELASFLNIRAFTIDVHPGISGVIESIRKSCGEDFSISKDTMINVAPRIRMTTLYAVAQSLPGGGRVANTCNASEDYIGYSTKYGDAAGDFSPCADFTVTEMLQIGEELGLPAHLIHKTPSDGLSGMSDEEKIGFSYAVLDHYIRTGECPDEEVRAKIDRMHALNLHKLEVIPAYRRETR